jgi:hypothetical protein
MNILAIEILPDHEAVVLSVEGKKEKKYPAVKLTISEWYFWTKTINAYPVFDDVCDDVDYVDDLGKDFHCDVNDQICKFVTMKHIQKKI